MFKISRKLIMSSVLLSSLLVSSTVFAESSQFQQGNQYEQAAYDLTAEQPTTYNWNRNSSYKSIDSDPYIKWAFIPSGSDFRGAIVVGNDGVVYAASREDGKVYAINPDGTEKWSFDTEKTISLYTTPVIGDDGTVYIGISGEGGLLAINPDGTNKWYTHLNRDVGGIAIDHEGVLYTTSLSPYSSVITAIQPDGSIKWEKGFSPKGKTRNTPVITSDGTILVLHTYGLEAFDKSGNSKWLYTAYNPDVEVPVIGQDGTIYFGAGKQYLYAINPDGTQKWKLSAAIRTTPVVDSDGVIYFGGDSKFYAVNSDSTTKWTSTFDKYLSGSPILDSSGNIYLSQMANSQVYIHALSNDGSKKWSLHVPPTGASTTYGAPPAIAKDGTIYISSGQGVTAIGGKIESPINFCEIFNSLTNHVNNGLNTTEEIIQARNEVDILKAKIQELENKVIDAESK